MTRTLFALTCILTLLFAASALLIRYELWAPGVSALFTGADGTPDDRRFTEVVLTHRLAAYLAVILLGATMASIAQTRGAPLAGLIKCTALDQMLRAAGIEPFILLFLRSILWIPACLVLYLGAFTTIATLPRMSWAAYVGLIAAIGTALATAMLFTPSNVPAPRDVYLFVAVPFAICAVIGLTRARPTWLIALTLGSIASVAVVALPNVNVAETGDTMADAAMAYLIPLGLAWFALPALILLRSEKQWPWWAVLAAVVAISVAMSRWIYLMLVMGTQGLPQAHVDYPPSFEGLNAAATVGILIFAALYLAINLMAARRAP